MKIRYNILVFAAALFAVVACTNEPEIIEFKSDVNTLDFEACGGVKKVRISSSDEWVASVRPQADGSANPWITVSPANGRGSVMCDFVISFAIDISSCVQAHSSQALRPVPGIFLFRLQFPFGYAL